MKWAGGFTAAVEVRDTNPTDAALVPCTLIPRPVRVVHYHHPNALAVLEVSAVDRAVSGEEAPFAVLVSVRERPEVATGSAQEVRNPVKDDSAS
jgi:hypothetical protein